ncbi:MAG: nickel-dependent lactate racemase [Thermoplasmatota archaeon]
MRSFIEYAGRKTWSGYLDSADVLEIKSEDGPPEEPYAVLRESLIVSEELENALKDHNRIGLIVNDRNRPTPTHLFFEFLVKEMVSHLGNIKKVHIATGSHKEPGQDEISSILGPGYNEFIHKVHVHDAREEKKHIDHGATSRGTPIWLDSELEEHDLFIFLNSVEPHYFAGFTGGRKSIIPGMAHFETIEKNHRFALDPASRTLGLKGNPVHEDMMEALEIFLKKKEHISIQMVQGPGKELSSVHIGDMWDSFHRACDHALLQFCLPITERYDVVVSVARSPMDKTLYQAQKAMENGKLALKKGGTLVLVASCSDGIGQSTFWDLLSASEDPNDVLRRIDKGYKLGYHKAAKIVQLGRSADIYLVSSLDEKLVEKGFMSGYGSLDEALTNALKGKNEKPRILLIPDGTVTVPYLKEKEGSI